MVEVKTSKLSNLMKEKILKHINELKSGLNNAMLKELNSSLYIKYIESKKGLLSFCIYANIDKHILLSDLDYESDVYESELYEDLTMFINNMYEESIYIFFLESIVSNCGYGQKILDELKKESKTIVLYSVQESENFWIKNGFENIFGHEYILHNK